MKQGEMVNVSNIGLVKISKARKAGPCWGWVKKGDHDINVGDLYVNTELAHSGSGNPFAMQRCCLDCLEEK